METFRSSSLVAVRACTLVAVVSCASCASTPAPVPPLPRAAYAHYLDGKLAMYEKHYDVAVAALLAAAAAAPDQPMIAVALATAQDKSNAHDAAKATLDRARDRWPRRAEVWEASGDLLVTANPDEAAKNYRRAIELDPDSEPAYLGLARVELDRGHGDDAEKVLGELVDHVPASVDGHYRLGQRYAARDDWASAITEFRATLEHDPDHIDARVDLGRSLFRQGQLRDAIVEIRNAFDRSGQDNDLAAELFGLLCEADDRQGALDLLTLMDDDENDVTALALVARLDRQLGRLDDARILAERIARKDPDIGAIALAEVQLAAGDPTAAAATALTVEPDARPFATARRVAADAQLAAHQPQLALDALAPARTAKPRDITLAGVAATAMADAGDVTKGRALLASLTTSKDDLPLQLARARFEEHVGATATAITLLEATIRSHPDSASALNQAGYLLVEANQRLSVAEGYLARARMASPGDAEILDSWGWLLFHTHHLRPAILALDKASRFAPREPEILFHLASAWAADGAPRTARALLDRAEALRPTPAVTRRMAALRHALPAGDTIPK